MHDSPASKTSGLTRVDNLIRQKLMISNPSDPLEVARGLERLYSDDAARLESDRSGLPLTLTEIARREAPASGPSTAELEEAKYDLENDLNALVAAPQLKDIKPELQGWQRHLPELVVRGAGAARAAVDEGQRVRALAVRQELGDYARLARLLGATTPEFNGAYRSLAKSLDEASSVIVVLAGEAIAARGFGGIAALPAPASELETRRDTVLNALRILVDPSLHNYSETSWPRGIHALNAIITELDNSGQGHLKALLQEQHLSFTLNKLIEHAGHADARLLRGLGATAAVTIGQLDRLVGVLDEINRVVDPESPPIRTLREALALFINGFRPERGLRLILASRSPLLSYGFYGTGSEQTDHRILELLLIRGRLAALLDCYLGCGCGDEQVFCQAAMDKLLYDLDRAIDRYLQDPTAGTDGSERRAAAFGLLFEVVSGDIVIDHDFFAPNGQPQPLADEVEALRNCVEDDSELERVLERIGGLLLEALGAAANDLPIDGAESESLQAELCLQRRNEARWIEFARAMTPGCTNFDRLHQRIDGLLAAALYLTGMDPAGGLACDIAPLRLPGHYETTNDTLATRRQTTGAPPEDLQLHGRGANP